MKRLVNEILDKNLSTDQILEVCHVVREYRFAVRDFHGSLTPEAEALARWRMDDCRVRCRVCFKDCGLEVPHLSELV